MNTVTLFGLNIWKETKEALYPQIRKRLQKRSTVPDVVVTPNVDHLVKLYADTTYFNEYSQADYIVPDGFPIVLASYFLGRRIKQRITGVDLIEAILLIMSEFRGKVFIIGGDPGSENTITKRLKEKYPYLELQVFSPDYSDFDRSDEGKKALKKINVWVPDVVLVCLGAPKSEKWIFHYKKQLETNMILSLGAALHYELGFERRAPRIVQVLCLEWFWRFCKNPEHLWKRYFIDDIKFLMILYRELVLRWKK